MLASYIEGSPVPIYASGTPYNTGDGIKMVMDVGADLWHMNRIEWAPEGFLGYFYPGASNLPECIIAGIIAGRNVVAETPRE